MSEPGWVTATRTSYDAMARHDPFVSTTADFDGRALDRAVLGVFAACVAESGGGPVLDVGCGPGTVTGVLRDLGLDAAGLDLSPGMVAHARAHHPGLTFGTGDLRALPGTGYAGLLAHHSIVHAPWPERPAILAHWADRLAPGGHLMVTFLAGDGHRHIDGHRGVPLDLTWYRQTPEGMADLLTAAGLTVRLTAVRPPEHPGEELPQAWLLARRK